MRLGVLVATMLLVTCGYVECQKASIQVDQAFGVSSFYPNSDHYKMKFAYQYGIGFGYLLTQNIEFNIGCSYQMAGAADYFWETVNSTSDLIETRQTYNTSFIKIPIDIVYKFGNELNYLISIGYYFGSNVSSSVSTESLDGTILSTIPIEILGENDYGLRFKQGIILPVLEKFQLQTGLLQEVGLKEFWSNTKHFNFGCFIALRFGFGD